MFQSSISVAQDAPYISWNTLGLLNNETGEVHPTIKKIENQSISVSGFIVPLEDGGELDSVTEFLLVPNPLMCIHVPPPPPNQMIFVTMVQPIPLDMDFRGVEITGKLTIPRPKTEYGFVSYEMAGVDAREADLEDPYLEIIPDLYDAVPTDNEVPD